MARAPGVAPEPPKLQAASTRYSDTGDSDLCCGELGDNVQAVVIPSAWQARRAWYRYAPMRGMRWLPSATQMFFVSM